MKRLVCLVTASLGLSASAVRADHEFCVGAGDLTRFNVEFDTLTSWENGVRITNSAGKALRTFNNYVGRRGYQPYVAREWQQAGGTFTSIARSSPDNCYRIAGVFQNGVPRRGVRFPNGNRAMTWSSSQQRVAQDPDGATVVRFDDEHRYPLRFRTNVRIVTIPTRANFGLAVIGTRVCAPIGARVNFDVRMDAAAVAERGVRIFGPNAKMLRSFYSHYGKKVNREWQQGPGNFALKTNPYARCFGVKGVFKYEPPNDLGWHFAEEVVVAEHRRTVTLHFKTVGGVYHNGTVIIALR